MVKHLPIYGSDHAPIILETLPLIRKRNNYNMKFKEKWLLDKEFFALVKSMWSNYIRSSYAYEMI